MPYFSRQSLTHFEGESGRIELLPEGIVYTRIAHDGEVSDAEVNALLQCINVLCRKQRPLVLVDRSHRYWLSFAAQQVLMEHTNFAAIAYWVRRPISGAMAEFAMHTYYRNRPVRVFRYRTDAMEWLRAFQPTEPKMA